MNDHAQREVQRVLSLTTPHFEGPDVRKLQEEINDRFKGWELPARVDTDGEFGPHTKERMNRVLYLLGADPEGQGKAGPLFTEKEQRLVRDPDTRTANQKERSKRRVEQAQAARQRTKDGNDKAADWMLSKKGTTESPPGSNWGPEGHVVRECIEACGFGPGTYWCGCIVEYALRVVADAPIPVRTLVHNQALLQYAAQGTHNIERVSAAEADRGCVVSYNFAHIGMLLGPIQGGRLHTIEGNTSSGGSGSQNNGGGIYERTDRSLSTVSGIVRVEWN